MTPSMAHAGNSLRCWCPCGEIIGEPAPQQVPDAGIALGKHEMIGIADEMQLAGLAGALEQLDGLLGASSEQSRDAYG